MAPLRTLLAAVSLAPVCAVRDVRLNLDVAEKLEREAASAGLKLDAGTEVFNGTDIELRQLAEGLEAGPFPSFVTVITKKKNWDQGSSIWTKCGGMLYRRKFILTAGHCVTNDPAEWDMHAYLNPYLSPFTVEEFLVRASTSEMVELLGPDAPKEEGEMPEMPQQGREPESKEQAVTEFKQGQRLGLGRWLEVAPQPQGKKHFGYLHPKYELEQQTRPAFDIALVPLATAPFSDDAPEWKYFDMKLSGFSVGQQATAVGLGASNGWDNKCGLYRNSHSCIVQQKKLDVISNAECFSKIMHVFWPMIKPGGDLSDEKIREAIEQNPQALAPGQTVDDAIRQAREDWELWNSALGGKEEYDFPTVGDEKKGEALDDAVLDKLLADVAKIGADFRGLKDGRQFCVMSTDRTGNIGQGDSGGPLVAEDGSVLGVASWTVVTNGGNHFLADGQVYRRMPSIYASTAVFQSWIDNTIDTHELV